MNDIHIYELDKYMKFYDIYWDVKILELEIFSFYILQFKSQKLNINIFLLILENKLLNLSCCIYL